MPTAPTCVARVPIFQGLSAQEQLEVAQFAKAVTVKKGEVLSAAGSHSSRLLVVHYGRLKISRVTAEGREQILRTVRPGEVVGERAFLTGRPTTDLIVAAEDTQVCTFEHGDLATLLTQYPDVVTRMLRTLSDRLAATETLLTAVTSADVGARVAAYLLGLAGEAAAPSRVTLPMSKKEIAAYLGTAPETLSRSLSQLASKGIIESGAGRDITILDLEGLRHLAAPVS